MHPHANDLPEHHANSSRTLFRNPSLTTASPRTSRGQQSERERQAEQWWWNREWQMPALPLAWAREHSKHPDVKPVEVVRPTFGLEGGNEEGSVKATWLGHASWIVSLPTNATRDGQPTRILFDPIFSARAGPTPYTGVRRRLPAPCDVKDLPPFHYVVFSHNHYDHLDLPTLQSIQDDPRRQDVRYLVPLGIKALLTAAPLRISPSRVFELDWWETLSFPLSPSADKRTLWLSSASTAPVKTDRHGSSVVLDVPGSTISSTFNANANLEYVGDYGEAEEDSVQVDVTRTKRERWVKFVCTPAQHTSGRGVLDSRTTLWSGWIVETHIPSVSPSLPTPPSNPPPAQDQETSQGQTHTHNDDGRVAVYFSGDTGYMTPSGPCKFFDEIGTQYGPIDLALLPIWRGGSLSFVSKFGFRIVEEALPATSLLGTLTAMHASPSHALAMHRAVRSKHSLAMHFGTFSGTDGETMDALLELVEARDGNLRSGGEEGKVGDWWEEGGMGWIDIGRTAVFPVGGKGGVPKAV